MDLPPEFGDAKCGVFLNSSVTIVLLFITCSFHSACGFHLSAAEFHFPVCWLKWSSQEADVQVELFG